MAFSSDTFLVQSTHQDSLKPNSQHSYSKSVP
jgi:hypothetical protein